MTRFKVLPVLLIILIALAPASYAASIIPKNWSFADLNVAQRYLDVLQKYPQLNNPDTIAQLKPMVSRYAKELGKTLLAGVKAELLPAVAGDTATTQNPSRFSLSNLKSLCMKVSNFSTGKGDAASMFESIKREINGSVDDYGKALNAIAQGKNTEAVTQKFVKEFNDVKLNANIRSQIQTITTQHFNTIASILNSANTPSSASKLAFLKNLLPGK